MFLFCNCKHHIIDLYFYKTQVLIATIVETPYKKNLRLQCLNLANQWIKRVNQKVCVGNVLDLSFVVFLPEVNYTMSFLEEHKNLNLN